MIKSILALRLKGFRHIVKDAFELKQRLQHVHVPDGSLLYRIDMKSFFMSGEPIELARTVSACFNNAAQRDAMLDGILFLLTHQYIVSDREQHSGRLWQVVKGTGMGLQHSSELANLALLLLVEEGFAISRIVQERFGIVCYFRYFDDI